jgi:transcriptional regulator with XRE-family HTH domain
VLSRATVEYDGKGLAEVTIKSLEAGTNQPGPETIRALAHALGVPPEEFPEYGLALARQKLDERKVGLDQAIRNFSEVKAAMRLETPEEIAEEAARLREQQQPQVAPGEERKSGKGRAT